MALKYRRRLEHNSAEAKQALCLQRAHSYQTELDSLPIGRKLVMGLDLMGLDRSFGFSRRASFKQNIVQFESSVCKLRKSIPRIEILQLQPCRSERSCLGNLWRCIRPFLQAGVGRGGLTPPDSRSGLRTVFYAVRDGS